MPGALTSLKQALLYSKPSRRLLGWWVDSAHRRLAQAVRGRGEVPLRPLPPPTCGGHVEHYYHFLFDLLLPLHQLLRSTDPETTFVLKPFGLFTNRLLEMFPGRVIITGTEPCPEDGSSADLLGMNPKHVWIPEQILLDFQSEVFDLLSIRPDAPARNIVLIERMPPDPYFIHEASNKGSGTSRRSIVNHDEVRDMLQDVVRPPYRFMNARLETMTFREQIACFAEAAAVIGQHGAGLSNVIWMKPGSTLVEFGSPLKRHFEFICESMEHRYLRIPTMEDHARIDCGQLRCRVADLPGFSATHQF